MTLLDPLVVAQVEVLKFEFLERVRPTPYPEVEAYWAKYQNVFAGGSAQHASSFLWWARNQP